MKPTSDMYKSLDDAYSHFNKRLFNGVLPPCVITLHRKKGAHGYFWGDTWSERDGKKTQFMDEIALNPEHFEARSLEKILSTLVHEMCHLQQHHFGRASHSGYHNTEWSEMMNAVGLIPTDTGEIGGKQTGRRVTHVIEQGGGFNKACAKLMKKGFTLPWQAITGDKDEAQRKAASKTKYRCEACDINAWAKPDTKLVCGECLEAMAA